METQKKCGSCKKKLSNTQITMAILSFYILFASIYGTIKLIKDIISIFG